MVLSVRQVSALGNGMIITYALAEGILLFL